MPKILLILDGLTDDAVLGGKTPLEAAQATHIARFKKEGASGFFRTIPQGCAVDSLSGISTLLGVPPAQLPTGRAYLEALSCGVSLRQEDAVCRCNLVEIDEKARLKSSCGGALSAEQMQELSATLAAPGLTPMGGYKNLLLLGGMAEEQKKLVTYPPHQHLGEALERLLPTGDTPLATHLRAFAMHSKRRIGGAEYLLLPWDSAVQQALPQFEALHKSTAACVCATAIVRGIALAMGLHTVTPAGTTGDTDTDLVAKAQAALALLRDYPLVILHCNGTDEVSHRKDSAGKAAFIAKVDELLIGTLLKSGMPDLELMVCSDHSTLSATGQHRADLQPFLLWNGKKHGELGTFSGTQAIPILKGC